MASPRPGLILAVLFSCILFPNRASFGFEVYTQPREITGIEAPISSPDGRFDIFYSYSEKEAAAYGQHQVWLRPKYPQAKPVLLYSYGRDANVSWSPDSTMVAITDFEGSSSSHVVLFRISQPQVIETVPGIDDFVALHYHEMFSSHDHFYAEVVGWTVDSGALALELRGDFTEWDWTQTEYTTYHIQRQVKFRIP